MIDNLSIGEILMYGTDRVVVRDIFDVRENGEYITIVDVEDADGTLWWARLEQLAELPENAAANGR